LSRLFGWQIGQPKKPENHLNLNLSGRRASYKRENKWAKPIPRLEISTSEHQALPGM
jgi:hypothetical protein